MHPGPSFTTVACPHCRLRVFLHNSAVAPFSYIYLLEVHRQRNIGSSAAAGGKAASQAAEGRQACQ